MGPMKLAMAYIMWQERRLPPDAKFQEAPWVVGKYLTIKRRTIKLQVSQK